MSKRYKLAAIAGLAVVMVAVLVAGQALAQTSTPTPAGMMGGNTGMMGGNSGMMASGTVTPTVPSQNSAGSSSSTTGITPYGMMGGTQGMPYGMMGGAQGMMGGMQGMMGGMQGMMSGMQGMMGMSGGWSDPNAKPLTLDQAQAAAQKYIQGLPNNAAANLAPMEVMEFSNGFYVAVGDKTTNSGAFEVLVDRYDGSVSPEPGPNMMWNTKYGMMSGQQTLSPMAGMMSGGQTAGMMGGSVAGGSMAGMMGLWSPPPATPTLSQQQVRTNAEQFLAIKFPTAKLPADMMTFPGYYTLDFEVSGQPAGMLSVNAYTGQVWYHTWHGQFLSERSMPSGS